VTERPQVVVVGLGPGGEEAAGRLAEHGLSVVGVDGRLVGGECPYWGCVPSKMMVRSADLLAEGLRIPGMAGASQVRPTWSPVARRIREEATDHWDDRVAVERLERRGARFVRGWGRLDGPGRVVVGDMVLEPTVGVVVNVGTVPWAPPVPGLADVPYWTNREAVECEVVPRSLVVLGGGAIGLELGQTFRRFGSEVTVVEVADRLLAQEEPECSALVTEVLATEGVRVRTGATVSQVAWDGAVFALELEDRATVTGERLLVASGRRADLAGLGTASVGLDPGARFLPVDDHCRVKPGLWALGDVTGKGAFTHMSMYQQRIVVADVLREAGVATDPVHGAEYHAVPRVTFTEPEVGSVGLSEADARARGLRVRVGTALVPSSTRGWIHKAGNAGLIKLVEDVERGVLVGATSAGPWGGEVLGLLALAVHAEVPTARLQEMIFAYPTFHRAIEAALDDLSG
jgi:pyruvate/2-oxoglutarate dehydrogenase complex dihydrolipoamide dehydrogenase (E3) component